jgi:hypothetical protein
MRIESEFIRLPLSFDAERLLTEVKDLPRESFITHPLDPRNLAIILVSVGGTVNDEFANEGQMLPTPYLQACPYIQQVLAAFQTPISRTRLMIIPPGEKCALHDDICLHWYRRTRIHVPIVTNEQVKFICNDRAIHMRAGEAWIFDNFLPHAVMNTGTSTRIHLVADTGGSQSFWQLVASGEQPRGQRQQAAREDVRVPYIASATPELLLEPYSFDVLSAAEVAAFAQEISRAAWQLIADQVLLAALDAALAVLVAEWSAALARHGSAKSCLPVYSKIMSEFTNSAIGSKLSESLPRYSDAGIALGVMRDSFLTTMRDDKINHTPDAGLLHLAIQRM